MTKAHHSIIDGVSGAEVLAAFLDLTPDGASSVPPVGEAHADGATGSDGGSLLEPSRTPRLGGQVHTMLAHRGGLGRWRELLGAMPHQVDAGIRTVAKTVQTAAHAECP